MGGWVGVWRVCKRVGGQVRCVCWCVSVCVCGLCGVLGWVCGVCVMGGLVCGLCVGRVVCGLCCVCGECSVRGVL